MNSFFVYYKNQNHNQNKVHNAPAISISVSIMYGILST